MADAPPLPPGFTLDSAPPPPPGFKLDAAAAKPAAPSPAANTPPPPPPGFKLDGPVTGFIKGVGGAFADIPKEYVKEAREGAGALKGDFTAPVQSHDKQGKPGAPGVKDYAARAGQIALDALGYMNSPITAAATSIVGRPVEKLTGIPKRTTGDVVSFAAPFAGDIKAAVTTGGAARDAIKATEKLFSPTTVSPEAGAAERTIRRATGEGNLAAEKAANRLVEHNKTLANLPVDQQRAFIGYVENRSKGAKLADPKLQQAADDIAKVYDQYRERIAKVLPADQVPKFVEDYYTHMWKEKPSVVGERINAIGKQGSGRNFKARSIPTIAEGIQAGLTPKFENPVDATMAYAHNMSRFVATHDIQNELKLQGYAKFYKPGEQPSGWVPLNGIMTDRFGKDIVTPEGTTAIPAKKMFAPADVARVYNNFISKGLEQGDTGPVWEGARKLSNGMTMLKLGLSTFHLATMANEAVISDVARAFGAASRGELGTAAKAAGGALAAPVMSARRGLKMQRELLDKAMPDSMSKTVNDAFVRSGGQLKMDPFYRTRPSGSFFNAMEKGTFKKELKEAADRIYKGTPWEKAKGSADLAANLIQSTAAPLFEKYIPMVKRGAFASRMEDFLKANPAATQDEIDKMAIKVQDSIDNRFGELVQDNLFWQKWMKQIAQIVLLSPTWNLGTIREIGGGLKDIAPGMADVLKGKGISDRTAYVAALASVVALENGVATYLKTGEKPTERDLLAYRTGGRDITSGAPERAMTPGYQKDVYAFGYDFPHHILEEAGNKLNPALQTAIGMATNKDYRGLPIFRPEGVKPVPGEPTPLDFALDTFMPISVGQFSKGRKRGSNISLPERVMSIRPAPAYITDPERVERMKTKFGTQEWRKRIRADAREKARQEP